MQIFVAKIRKTLVIMSKKNFYSGYALVNKKTQRLGQIYC